MTENRTHICIFFDDGGLDPRCACGRGAAYLPENDEADALLILLDDAPRAEEFAISA